MNHRHFPLSPYQPQLGCLMLMLVAFFLTCLAPLFLVEAAQLALLKLHLSPPVAALVLMGIFLGGLVNLPLWIVQRSSPQPFPHHALESLMGWMPLVHRQPARTVIAVNVGGCVIPVGLAIFEFALLMSASPQTKWALLIAVAVNSGVCYYTARPVPGVGIAMPAFLSPAVSVLVTWLLLAPEQYAMVRAPVAFIAGVLGPLLGADLLNLRRVSQFAAPMISIGGAGTFDGIVLSGLLAAFLA